MTWTFETRAPHTPAELQSFSVTNGELAEGSTYEGLCCAYEQAYASYSCECCLELATAPPEDPAEPGPCGSCIHVLGWHRCERDQVAERWRAGSLHSGQFDVASTLWALARRQVQLEALGLLQ